MKGPLSQPLPELIDTNVQTATPAGDERVPRMTAGKMVRGGALTLGGRIATAGFGFLNAVLAARILGPRDFGLYSVALGVALTVTIVGSAGVDHSLLAILPARVREGRHSASRVLGSSLLFVVVLSTAIVLPLALVRESFAALLSKPQLGPWLAIMLLSVPFAAMLHVARAAAQAAFAFRHAVVPLAFGQPILILIGLILIHLGFAASPLSVAVAYVVAVALTAVVAVWWLSRLPAYGWSWLRHALPIDPELSERSAPFLGIQVFINLKSSVLLFVLAATVAASDVGLFSAAARTAGLVSFILIAVNSVFAPAIASIWADKDTDRLASVYRNMTRWTVAVSIPLCVGLAVCAPGILGIFGEEYRAAALALALLACGQLVNAATGSVGYLLMMTGSERLVLRNAIGVTAASFILGILVAPRYGYVGVAAAQAVVVAGFNLLMLYQVWRRLGLNPYNRDMVGAVVAGTACALAGMALYGWAWTPGRSLVAGLLVVGSVMAVVYIAIMAAFGLSDEDRAFIADTWSRVRVRFA